MGTNAFRAPGLKLELEETAEETTVHCSGRITAESAEMFQSEIRDRVIPISRGKGVAVTRRIVLDLSQVTFIDSTGLGALLLRVDGRTKKVLRHGDSQSESARRKAGQPDKAGPGFQQNVRPVRGEIAFFVTLAQRQLPRGSGL